MHLSIYPFINLSIYHYLSVYLLSHLSIYYPFIHLSILSIIYQFFPSIHLSNYSSHVRRTKYLIAPGSSSTGYGIAYNSRVKTPSAVDFWPFTSLLTWEACLAVCVCMCLCVCVCVCVCAVFVDARKTVCDRDVVFFNLRGITMDIICKSLIQIGL